MGNNKITGLAPATENGDAVDFEFFNKYTPSGYRKNNGTFHFNNYVLFPKINYVCVIELVSTTLFTQHKQVKNQTRRILFKIFRAMLTKHCFKRTIINKHRSFIYLSKTNSMSLNASYCLEIILR